MRTSLGCLRRGKLGIRRRAELIVLAKSRWIFLIRKQKKGLFISRNVEASPINKHQAYYEATPRGSYRKTTFPVC